MSPAFRIEGAGPAKKGGFMARKQFKVEVVKEGALGALFFGASKLPINKMEELMNKYGNDGWNMDFMVIEKYRLLLFWKREAAVITFSKEIT